MNDVSESDTEPFATSYERTEAEGGPAFGALMLAAIVLCLALVMAADLMSLSLSIRLLMFNINLSDKSPFAKNGASKGNVMCDRLNERSMSLVSTDTL